MVTNEAPKDDATLAHAHCGCNRSELEKSEICGCFSCLDTFPPAQIVEWIDEPDRTLFRGNVLVATETKREQTALCPKCGIDSVIGSLSGYPITAAFLRQMYGCWFA
jgi:hypothetical protein